MESQVAVPDVKVEAKSSPPVVARTMARVAGVLFVLAIVLRLPEAQRRGALLFHSDESPGAGALVGLAGFGFFLALHAVPSIWLLRGKTRLRRLALVVPIVALVVFVLMATVRVVAEGQWPPAVEVVRVLAFVAAAVLLLTGRPSRSRLRAGVAIGCIWFLLSVVSAVAPM